MASQIFLGMLRSRIRAAVVLCAALLLGAQALPVQAQGPGCEAAEHGMRADGSDNVAALTTVLNECAGHRIHIPHGTYVFSPSGFAPGIKMPANTELAGEGYDGPNATVFKIADSGTFQALLWVRNVSNVAIGGIRFEGSSYDSGCSRHLDYGHAIYVQSDTGAPGAVNSVDISKNFFNNFNGQSWITVAAADRSPGITGVTIVNNVFNSDASLRGGCAGTGGISYPVAMVWLRGSDLSAEGLVTNVTVRNNTFNAGYVKDAVASWSGTRDITIEHNAVGEAGLHLPPAPGTELGRYAILVYHSAHERPGLMPENVRVAGNVITSPVSCGIYVAGGRNLEIVENHISGQSDRFDATLPKGAIALNHVQNVTALRDNELSGNAIGISSVGSQINMGSNRISGGGVAQKIR